VDEARLIDLYDLHARELVGFFARRSGDPELAVDLVAETFVSAFEQRRKCRGQTGREEGAWLFAIAANKLTDYYRHEAAERRSRERLMGELRTLHPHESWTIKELAESGPEDQRLHAAFAGLSDEQREAVTLRVIDERPYGEVSRELGIAEPAARARVSRGLRTLRRAIAGDREEKT
jgi:RNA polymerase sigma factor (sigma-70 family)